MAEPVAPVVNDLSRPFWDAAAEGRLVLPSCVTTERAFWPPSPSSPFVLNGLVEWREVAAEGILLSRVTYRRAFQKAFSDRLTYAVALIEVAPGVRLQAYLTDPDGPGAPLPGARVRIGFAALAEGGPPVPIVEAA